MSKRLPSSEEEMLCIQHVTRANYVKYGTKLMEITSNYSSMKLGIMFLIIFPMLMLNFIILRYFCQQGILMQQQDRENPDIFTDLTQVMPSDEIGPDCSPSAQKSPYFAGRKSGAYKRKRTAGTKTGGERKLTKKGKWFGKSDGRKTSYSSNKASGTASRKSSTPHKPAQSSNKGLSLLAPPRPRTVKKE